MKVISWIWVWALTLQIVFGVDVLSDHKAELIVEKGFLVQPELTPTQYLMSDLYWNRNCEENIYNHLGTFYYSRFEWTEEDEHLVLTFDLGVPDIIGSIWIMEPVRYEAST